MKTLVVDADAVSRRLAALLFKRLDLPLPDFAEDAASASRDGYGLVLVDAGTGLDGLAALRGGAGAPRLVAMIAPDSESRRQACLDAGAQAVLVKPLTLQALSGVLESMAPEGRADGDWNPAAWAELRQLFGPQGTAQLARTLAEDLPVQADRMSAALREADLPALKRVAHALRGACLQLGATGLAEACARVERAAAGGEAESAMREGAGAIRRYAALVERVRDEAGPR